ncbi:AraC family transcriptional regulator [Pseudomonas protegens]|uniref:AraC family transcriptional regulator n=1 Tax=Pseudomonas protegens TaxID=380021 RepID=UPI000F464660|nr:AraC family transcriptional regulator [Pseudomonas protegens]NAN54073.1 AraC family transcriptional regulator [Pseudomonas protegens]NUE77221.1 AraC family transcriptional regulator [Pseudomonas protegens]ROM13716.1 AraC family transcriptional regulator [Pseudomonas protegens]
MLSPNAAPQPVKRDSTLHFPNPQHTGSAAVVPEVTLSTGTVLMDSQMWMQEPLWEGLKIILVLSGQLNCRVEGQPEVEIRGPTLCAVANQGEHCGDHLFASGVPVRYTTVQLDFPSIRNVGLEPERLLDQRGGGPMLFCQPASKPLLALAQQIFTCPLQGPTRSFYLGGKALELTALGVEGILAQAESRPLQDSPCSSAEIERIHAARDLLLNSLQDSPSLSELSRQVGLNPRKLTAGFRQVFGTSVYAYLQEQRLGEAYRLLASGETNVSSAAYRVGYSPAHFSTAFRKRFGVSPKSLR